MGFFKSIGHALTHNHTLQMLFDPVKPIEKVVSTAHDDVAQVVSYGGKHLVQDVDNLSSGLSNMLPMILGAGVILVLLKK